MCHIICIIKLKSKKFVTNNTCTHPEPFNTCEIVPNFGIYIVK